MLNNSEPYYENTHTKRIMPLELQALIAIIEKRIQQVTLTEEEQDWIDKLHLTLQLEPFKQVESKIKPFCELLKKLSDSSMITETDLFKLQCVWKNSPLYLNALFKRAQKESLLILLSKRIIQDLLGLPHISENLMSMVQKGFFGKLLENNETDKSNQYIEFIQKPFMMNGLHQVVPLPKIFNLNEVSDIAAFKPLALMGYVTNWKASSMLNVFLGATALNAVITLTVLYSAYSFVSPQGTDYKREVVSITDNDYSKVKSPLSTNATNQLGNTLKNTFNAARELLPSTWVRNIECSPQTAIKVNTLSK